MHGIVLGPEQRSHKADPKILECEGYEVMSDQTPSTANPSTNGAGPSSNGVDNLPVLDPSTAPSVQLVVRAHIGWWDRLKVVVALVAVWWLLLWTDLANNPIESFSTAFHQQISSLWWVEALIVLEFVRQLHYSIAERSPRWYRLWSLGIFALPTRLFRKTSDWTRFRLTRVLRILFALFILALLLGALFHVSPAASLFLVPSALFSALPLFFTVVFYILLGVMQFVGIFWFMSRGGIDVHYPGDVKTRFSDVLGQDAVVDRVKENIVFLKDPESIEKRGGFVPGGILLWGPPGTGKTLLAEAVAGETENPFVFVDPGAFINMFMGVGILKVKSLFRRLRKLALRYGGVVVFFDEADSLGNRGAAALGGVFRPNQTAGWSDDHCHGLSYLSEPSLSELFQNSMRHEAEGAAPPRRSGMMMGGMMGGGMGTLQSLLSELSGLSKPRGIINRFVRRLLGVAPRKPPKYRILVMMATNMPQSLDEALLRPGRIDRIYKVGYPSKAGRIRTYQGYFSKVANNLTPEEIDRLATITPYATGATIKDLVNESLINAIREHREVIEWRDVIAAKQRKDLGPPEDVEYIERERHSVAVHEACHALVAATLRKDVVIDIATIEKGGNYLGFVSSARLNDTFTRWRSDFEVDIMVSLASLAGEKLFFEGDNSSGVSGDLESATFVASYMEGYWGMGRTVASIGVAQQVGAGQSGGGRDRMNERLARSVGDRVEGKLGDLLTQVRSLLKERSDDVLAIAYALESHKTITGEDVMAILNGTQGPLVDGRRYHSDAFRLGIVAYHNRAVLAHQARGQVGITLPELPELEAVLGGVSNQLDAAGVSE
jgi:cell division protease FtsH